MTFLVAILAGGQSRRMGGQDKALAMLGGERLIDRVLACVLAQADRIVISGRSDYGAGLPVVHDLPEGPRGPAAGVFAIDQWLRAREPAMRGFFTAPVDGPFLPGDLIVRLAEAAGPAIAADEAGAHPTFAYWSLAALETAWTRLRAAPTISLWALAAACGAREVCWPGAAFFANVNSPEDLARAAEITRRQE